ncbi:MAG: hypothetical protein ACRDOH_24760, partial [Streptosporangiaceae bacterium]
MQQAFASEIGQATAADVPKFAPTGCPACSTRWKRSRQRGRVRCWRDGDDHAGPRRAGGVPGRARPDGHVRHLRPG